MAIWTVGNALPFMVMVVVILIQSGNMLITKVAMSAGTNRYVMVVYSDALATLFLCPFAFLLHRSQRPPLSCKLLFNFFLLGLCAFSAQICGFVGIDLSSPTLNTSILNLIPAFTFILAVVLRIEEVDWKSSSSQAKIIGTAASVAGAFIITLYKGPPIKNSLVLPSSQSNWMLGGLLFVVEALMSSLWYIYQASFLKKYPAVCMTVCCQCLFATFQAALFSAILVRDPKAWLVKLDMGLMAIMYTGVCSVGIRFALATWCVKKAGPLFCAMFKPLGIIFTVFMGIILLGEHFYFGSLVGALVTVLGFYSVVWGKFTEEKIAEVEGAATARFEISGSGGRVPLLKSKNENC